MKVLLKAVFAIKKALNKIYSDNVGAYAAQSSFFIIVSIFPFIMLLLTLIQYTPITKDFLLKLIADFTPSQIRNLLFQIIDEIYSTQSIALISATAIAALWASGKGVLAIMQGLNSVFGITEHRNYIVRRFIASLYTLIFLIAMVFSLVLLVFGNQLLLFVNSTVPFIGGLIESLIGRKFLIALCFLTLFFMVVYKFIPNRKTSFVKELPGALLSALGWQLFSYFYSLYVDYSKGFSTMYGSLGTLIFAMLWMYFCMYIMFFGAEFNTFLEKKLFVNIFR